MSTPRASFSNDSRLVKMSLPKSVLLKDYLLDDLSSCSSNGFRSYPRRQCCTKVRYLIEIDLTKHTKLHPTRKKHILKNKSKSKSRSVLRKASTAIVSVFKNFQLSKKGFWKRTSDQNNKTFKRLDSFDKPIKQKDIIISPARKVSVDVTTMANMKTVTSNGNSNSSNSSNSYFTATSDSSSTNVAQNDVVVNMNTVNGDAKVRFNYNMFYIHFLTRFYFLCILVLT